MLWCTEGALHQGQAEGLDAECLSEVSITVGAAADQQQELSHGELCVNRSSII